MQTPRSFSYWETDRLRFVALMVYSTRTEQKLGSSPPCTAHSTKPPHSPAAPNRRGQRRSASCTRGRRLSTRVTLKPQWSWLASFLPRACDQTPTKLLCIRSLWSSTRKNITLGLRPVLSIQATIKTEKKKNPAGFKYLNICSWKSLFVFVELLNIIDSRMILFF